MHDAAPASVLREQVLDRKGREADEAVAALRVQGQQAALDRSDGRAADVPVFAAHLLGALGEVGQQGTQVLEVVEQQTVVVGVAEGDLQDAGLRLVEVEQTREQRRPDLRDRGAQWVALLAEQVPEHHRAGGEAEPVEAQRAGAVHEFGVRLPGPGEAGEVALDVGHEHRNPGRGEALGHHPQGHRLAGTGRARDQAVPVHA